MGHTEQDWQVSHVDCESVEFQVSVCRLWERPRREAISALASVLRSYGGPPPTTPLLFAILDRVSYWLGETGSSLVGGLPQIFACENRAGRTRWAAGFLEGFTFSPHLHSGATPSSPRFTLISSQDFDFKSRSNFFLTSLTRMYCLVGSWKQMWRMERVATGCLFGAEGRWRGNEFRCVELDELLSAFETEKRASDKGGTSTPSKCAIYAMCRALVVLRARLLSPLHTGASAGCSLAVVPHLANYGIRKVFGCKFAIGSEESRAIGRLLHAFNAALEKELGLIGGRKRAGLELELPREKSLHNGSVRHTLKHENPYSKVSRPRARDRVGIQKWKASV
ncbi:hypothetical protein PR048_008071 [Dryococelus australis]|uniref:Uncharacterized protein n=1 Tax=Dryococelus australis TaxID=614101 RepID=A0ABQ9HWW1_9NEOP|nr:hypothetical protein PR048_008071 [Dryococelus australis]